MSTIPATEPGRRTGSPDGEAPRTRDAFSSRLLLAAGAAIALAWGLLGFDVWRLHTQRVESAELQAASLARAVEQRVTRTLRVTDQTLKLARDEIAAKRLWNDPAALTAALEKYSPHLEEIITVSFVLPDGLCIAQSNPAVATGRRYVDFDYFKFHSTHPADDPFVEPPFVGPASGQRVFTMSRALRGRQGELQGILVAGVRTDVIAREFAELRIGNNGSIGFHHLPSYRILARQPDHEETFGRDIGHAGLETALAKAPIGAFSGAISADRVERLFAYRKLEELPLAVTVGIARADINARLRDDLAGYLATMLILTLAIGGSAAYILRAHGRERRLQQSLLQKDALFRAFFDAVPAGMCTIDREMRYHLVNPELARINGKALADYEGRTVAEVHPGVLKPFADLHRQIFATGKIFHDVEFHGRRADDPETMGHWHAAFFPIFGHDGQVDAAGCFIFDVTAQKNAEAELVRTESLLSTVLDVMPIGIWITDPQGRVVRRNPATAGHAGAANEPAVQLALREGKSTVGEMIDVEGGDGSRKTLLSSAIPLRDGAGSLLGAIAVNEDITPIRQAEEEMRISRDFFEQTFNAAPVGMAIADREGRYIKVNPAMEAFLGYSQDELLSMTYMDVTHPDDLATNVSLRKEMLDGDAAGIQMEKRYLRKDGRYVWATMIASRILDTQGMPLYTIGQMLDIDWRKRTEQSLRESEARFRAFFDNANTGIAATDENGYVSYFNEAFRSMLGYDDERLRAMNFSEFTHPDDVRAELQILDDICTGKRDSYRMEKRYLKADGSVIWIDLSSAAIRDAFGRITNLIAVVHDITESKEAALALAQSRQKLRALATHQTRVLEEDRKHIAREIHDELGQLLTALKMDISLLRLNFGDNPNLHRKSEEMRQLVDKTMAVVRQVATNLRPSALDLGLVPAIEWLAEDFSARWEIPCTVEAGDGEIILHDMLATTIFRVVQESLTNIARHAGATKVSINLTHDHRMLHLVVRDNGCGFDMVAAGKKKGFGFFGMRERVLSAGGQLSVDSAPGKGTTLSITLPMRKDIQQ